MASSSARAQRLGREERDPFHAVEVAIEYAAHGAVGTGDRPQHAPLLRERGAALLSRDGIRNGNRERSPWARVARKGSSGNAGFASLSDAPAEIFARMASKSWVSARKSLFFATDAEYAHRDNIL